MQTERDDNLEPTNSWLRPTKVPNRLSLALRSEHFAAELVRSLVEFTKFACGDRGAMVQPAGKLDVAGDVDVQREHRVSVSGFIEVGLPLKAGQLDSGSHDAGVPFRASLNFRVEPGDASGNDGTKQRPQADGAYPRQPTSHDGQSPVEGSIVEPVRRLIATCELIEKSMSITEQPAMHARLRSGLEELRSFGLGASA